MSDLRETLIDMAITHGDTRSREDSTYFVEDVLTVVREALLSDAAVESCLIAVGCGACEYYGDESAPCYQSCRKINRQGITAAMDAAGLGGDGHE